MVTKIVSGSLVDDIIQIALDNAYLLINILIYVMFIGTTFFLDTYMRIFIFSNYIITHNGRMIWKWWEFKRYTSTKNGKSAAVTCFIKTIT